MGRVTGQPGVPLSRDAAAGIAAAVAQFHQAFGLPMRDTPSAEIDGCLAKLRVALLEEEVGEFVTASEKGDLIGVADALADIVYVAYGTALTYGIDLDAVLAEVHRSNMSKLGWDGKPLIRDDGKVLKSDRYFRPDIAAVLALNGRVGRAC
jgi:predicted HAD superfamily Cof-like phosphohydrolase